MSNVRNGALRTLAMAAALAIVFALGLMTASAESPNPPQFIYVGGVYVGESGTVTGEGITGTVTYDAENGILTLDNATIDSAYKYENGYYSTCYTSIFCPMNELTVKLIGKNTLKYNIYGNNCAEIDFAGKGSVSITGSRKDSNNGNVAVKCGAFAVDEGTTVSIVMNDSMSSGTCAIDADNIGIMGNLSISVKGKDYSRGIYSNNGTCNVYITEGAKLNINLSATTDTTCYGINLTRSGELYNLGSMAITMSGSKKMKAVYGGEAYLLDGSKTKLSSTLEALDVDGITYGEKIAFSSGTTSKTLYFCSAKATFGKKYVLAGKSIDGKVKATNLSSLKKYTKSFKATWKKQSSSYVSGYQIRYSTKSSMSSAKTVTVKGASNSSKKISNLKKGKKYYVQVRTYRKVLGVTKYSSWSSKKSITVK